MNQASLLQYCTSKVHRLFLDDPSVRRVRILPQYRRDKAASPAEKRDKLFNYKRPTAEIIDGVGVLYVFPGKNYVEHYAKIYRQLGYEVEAQAPTEDEMREAVRSVFPDDFPDVDTVILGYVEPLAATNDWHDNEEISWSVQHIGGTLVAFVGVTFSYWGDIIYYIAERIAGHANQLIYVGKLGSLNRNDVPNKTIATGNTSLVEGTEITWNNIFETSPLVTLGKHASLPSVLDETSEWFIRNRDQYRFVDPEVGWAAKACQDNGIKFSYLHLVTDNLCGDFIEDLTNERDKSVVEKRLQYVGIMKSIIWHAISKHTASVYSAVLKAQQARVDRGLMRPLERNWQACLSFAYHTQEEAWEVVRELPRREWKDQEVVPEQVLSEMADTQIQLLTALAYAGFTDEDLTQAVLQKLQAKRQDWK